MATRHQVRQSVVSLLYANEMGSEMEEFSNEFLEEKKIRNDQKSFTLTLYNGVLDNLNLIDEALDAHLGKWKLGEIGAVERAILRLGAYEIKFTNTQSAIVINEAILLANELGSDSSTRFINGVLDAISKVN
ncbi:transcription antitermination factor NusB [Campylobacter fetus]|uniref:Transcription antitermination protein NusB n=3 Tax=Campylobacter fetus TaxID=196 RepID=NUSB_CAMFF|nr:MULTISPECIES: transcription antitermination factor NusB [Campylobacter]A0RQJ6.1 RecName: Full=Transcription antitermination protein NusB; AltName: Full=Antitermination factor NusB [Campylobacter fetus subsp. fetus 82-40]OCS22702.1 N utilization substance protein B [Campylobacter fetus subsp. venerealis cfvi97/532]OCS26872.1 N utilization substance protein B [Campylobacter fetus subsp. venerealis cfvB10]OCS30005.1 N utilization substance protein B [Campylobacter fetus subsp. venerealis LMG 65